MYLGFYTATRHTVGRGDLTPPLVTACTNSKTGNPAFLQFQCSCELAFVFGDEVQLVGELGGEDMERFFVAGNIF